jgi:hypothetical protein
MARAAAILGGSQHDDGHWEDFVLPVGRSDAWVTAYVGLALSDHAVLTGDADSYGAAKRAAGWLSSARGREPGWGYNGRTGPDSDSTAHAMLLLRRFGIACTEAATWIRDAWQPDGGFATYRRADAWGIAHPCVTPVAYLALDVEQQRELAEPFRRYVIATRDSDGTWPAYWWHTRHYSTFVNLLASSRLGFEIERTAPIVTPTGQRAIESAFDVACVAGIAALRLGDDPVTQKLVARVCSMERRGGGWPPGAGLRVTEPDCREPWRRPAGHVYQDVDGIFTTATALRVLVLSAEQARGPG